jgi:hypothetical protein
MRRPLLCALVLAAAWTALPITAAFAQGPPGSQRGGAGGNNPPPAPDPDDQAAKKKKDDEWGDKQAPLPALRNAGPCPFVKVLYDAARYVELKDNRETAAAVGYTGEIQSLSSACQYKSDDPIRVEMEVLFALGKGPQATSSTKTYRYWVAVTDRNQEVIAKEYFNLPVTFAPGEDRTLVTDKVFGISIPRGKASVSGSNFEVLVGFDVTPEMVAFNRDGKRFRPNSAVTTAAAATPGPAAKQ